MSVTLAPVKRVTGTGAYARTQEKRRKVMARVSRRSQRRMKRVAGLLALAILAVAVLCTMGVLAGGSDPGKPLHDRITPMPAVPTSDVSTDPGTPKVGQDASERESHYLSHLKSRGMTNREKTTTDKEMIDVGYMICSDFRNNDKADYNSERIIVEGFTDGDPVYASMYMDAATDILCRGVIDK